MTTTKNTTTTTAPTSTVVRQTRSDVVTAAPVLAAAVWCSTVGTTWTLELHNLARGGTRGTLVDWISSGIPTSQPVPDGLAHQLLADRGLHLFVDSTASSVHSRQSVGYVCADAELITLAHRVRDEAADAGVHPVLLAAQRIALA